MGGPSAKEIGLSPDLRSRLSPGGASFQLASTRYYVYGPGDDGVFVEYLFRAPGAVDDCFSRARAESATTAATGSASSLGCPFARTRREPPLPPQG